ncbi:unnamed protein product [Choristocarpus tenellus]
MSTCTPDLLVVGMQRGEEVANVLRIFAVAVVTSAISAWFSGMQVDRMIILFLHWISGLGYALSQHIMSIMIINCWSFNGLKPLIYSLKFVEICCSNVFSLSNLALTISLTHIVERYRKYQIVCAVSSENIRYLTKAVLVVALLMSLSSVPFWNELLVTGGYFWVGSTGPASHGYWISYSFSVAQTVSGILMVGVLSSVALHSWRELLLCSKNRRVKLYLVLSILGTIINLFNGISVILNDTINSDMSRELIMVSWCAKYIHMSLDTIALLTLVGKGEDIKGPSLCMEHTCSRISFGSSAQIQPYP